MVEQRGAHWLKTASAEQIVSAQQAGELVTYLGGQTEGELAHAAEVAGVADRVRAQAYGLGAGQLRSNGDRDSTWFEAKRRAMDPAQLEKLNWVESATPAEVYAAEQAGDLRHLTGQDVTDEQARLEAVAKHTHEVMAAALGEF